MTDGSILMGVIGKPHGVRGLLRVRSFTEDPADLAKYAPLTDDRGRSWTLTWRGEDIAELRDASGRPVSDRTEAEKLVNLRLYVPRERLPAIDDPDDFYVADLVGLQAIGTDGAVLGTVAAIHDYGAGASLEIGADGKREIFVPFTRACVPEIDLAQSRIIVLPPDEIEAREDAA